MEIKKKIVVPTGEIYTAIGEKGMLVALWAASSAMFQKWVLGEMPLLMI